MADTDQTYVSHKECGCVAMMVMADFKGVAMEVAKAIRRGELVSRCTVAEARAMPFYCDAHTKPPKKS